MFRKWQLTLFGILAISTCVSYAPLSQAQEDNTVSSPAVTNPGESPYDTYMRLGYAAEDRGDFQTAMNYFRDALFYVPEDREATIAYWNARNAYNESVSPTDATATESDYDRYMRLGYEATNRRDYQTALINFNRAQEIREDDYYAIQAIRNVETYIAAKKDQPLSQVETIAVQSDGKYYVGESAYDRYMRLGYGAAKEDQFADAVEYFYGALSERPGDRLATIAYWNVKHNLNAQNPDGTALANLSDYDRWMRLGYDATQQHQFRKALEYFEAALQTRPGDEYAAQAIRNITTYIQRGDS